MKNLNSVKVMFANSTYNYETAVSADTTEETAKKYFLYQTFNLGNAPLKGDGSYGDNMQKCIAIEFIDNNIFALNSVGKSVQVFGDITIPKNTVEIEYADGHKEQRFVEQLELIERCCNCRELDKDINCKKCLFYQ